MRGGSIDGRGGFCRFCCSPEAKNVSESGKLLPCPDLRLSRKWRKNDHDKNHSGQFLSGFVFGQVGQESNLQPAVLELDCCRLSAFVTVSQVASALKISRFPACFCS